MFLYDFFNVIIHFAFLFPHGHEDTFLSCQDVISLMLTCKILKKYLYRRYKYLLSEILSNHKVFLSESNMSPFNLFFHVKISCVPASILKLINFEETEDDYLFLGLRSDSRYGWFFYGGDDCITFLPSIHYDHKTRKVTIELGESDYENLLERYPLEFEELEDKIFEDFQKAKEELISWGFFPIPKKNLFQKMNSLLSLTNSKCFKFRNLIDFDETPKNFFKDPFCYPIECIDFFKKLITFYGFSQTFDNFLHAYSRIEIIEKYIQTYEFEDSSVIFRFRIVVNEESYEPLSKKQKLNY